ncbi:MAG TPA: SRPBCC family protein [Herbaspirillum sp.]|jgi:uncharacterized protein YndB with AHSA1/START domain
MTQDRIEKSIELKAPIERVWRALTDYKEFGTWFRVELDGPFVAGKLATGHMSMSCSGYENMKWQATVKEMKEPTLFSMTWHPYAIEPDADYSQETPTLIEFRLKSISGGTHLTIVESGFSKLPPHRQALAFERNGEGWGIQIKNIQTHVES